MMIEVAIKVFPEEFATDPERRARFEQEARASAPLNHPHVAVVHDIGHEGTVHFMAQEYLQGQSLRGALEKGALPLDKTLDLATEVSVRRAAAAGPASSASSRPEWYRVSTTPPTAFGNESHQRWS